MDNIGISRDDRLMHAGDDPRLAPGALLVSDDEPRIRRLIRDHLARDGDSRPVLETTSSRSVRAVLTRRPARPHLAGVLLEWNLRAETAVQVLPWLDFAYPRTPVVIYTRGDPKQIPDRLCRDRRLVRFPKSFAPQDVLRCARSVFEPWDRHVIWRRTFLLKLAGSRRNELTEHLLRMLDAYLESVSRTSLHRVRNLSAESLRKYRAQLHDIFAVGDIDDIRSRWERQSLGRFMSAAATK